jgi:ArsR family transcriptional regulator, arsenate/arsenite/antimonite-responsive transcriptional repressor
MNLGTLTFVNLPLLDLEPRRALGHGCCTHVEVELSALDVAALSRIGKALSDPVRVQIVDVLRRHAGEVCVCDLQPLFDIAQPTLSHHLKKLRDAGLVGVVRRGQFAYYYVHPGALEPLSAWLARSSPERGEARYRR